MPVSPIARRIRALLFLMLPALVLVACGSRVSTAGFKGEQHDVAQTISNLQADATAGDEKKICAKDLAPSVVSRLGGSKGCEKAIKNQLAEVDSLELSVQSITIAKGGASATVKAKSIHAGRTRPGTVSLVRDGKAWKVSGI
jgi:hypothetical protein